MIFELNLERAVAWINWTEINYTDEKTDSGGAQSLPRKFRFTYINYVHVADGQSIYELIPAYKYFQGLENLRPQKSDPPERTSHLE